MIPQKIHFIWFGRNPYPEKVQYCMESWKKHLPDYEFKLWNEDSFPIEQYRFTKEAYEEKKFAFVSDFVRIYALATEGGIYLDTDIEVLKSFDNLLGKRVFLGTDDSGNLTALMASEKGHPFFMHILNLYQKRPFLLGNGKLDTEVNNLLLERELTKWGFIVKNETQHLHEGIEVYPDDFFHVVSLVSGKMNKTQNSYAIHWHTLLWVSWKTRLIRFLRMKILVPILGRNLYSKLTSFIKQ